MSYELKVIAAGTIIIALVVCLLASGVFGITIG